MSEPNNIVKFRAPAHKKRRSTTKVEPTPLHELDLPSAKRMSPEQMLTALARSEAKEYDSAFVVLRKQELCPCGCGVETEVVEVFAAGEMHNERINWIADKMKFYAMGLDIGEEDG